MSSHPNTGIIIRGKLGTGEVIYLREEHTNGLYSTKSSVLKTYIQIILYVVNSLYLVIYVQEIYM